MEGISYCHHYKVTHRDLKLENILLTSKLTKKVKIIDFGIAGVSNMKTENMDMGSLRYMVRHFK